MVGVSEYDEGRDAGGRGDVEGLLEPGLVVVPYSVHADALEVGGDDHGLEGDSGVREAPALGDGVVGCVCPDDGECAGADVAFKRLPPILSLMPWSVTRMKCQG